MADFHAIQVTCDAVMRLLEESYQPELLGPTNPLQFEVYGTTDFQSHMTQGVSLFLYRVHVNPNQRAPLVNNPAGGVRRQLLPLDLHFFITVWAPEPSLQHAILGWTMRTLEDNPVLTAPLLNGVRDNVFRADETVELLVGQLTNEELMRIWDDLNTDYHLSVPYVARVVRIESLQTVSEGEPVTRREFEYGVLKGV
ncbi:MAG TPA: DUF4255 domain-containing protein [Pyrinomonadaceae bacterium]